MGFNLGNTLDTYNQEGKGFSWLGDGTYAGTVVSELETTWGNALTTQKTIDTYKNAGFNAVRIPVTWHKVCDKDYNIRDTRRLDGRVKEVVNYAVKNDMYIILNTHYDDGIFKLCNKNMAQSEKAAKKIWGQIAEEFKGYNEKLIFEPFNGPRTVGSSKEWSGGTAAERKKPQYP